MIWKYGSDDMAGDEFLKRRGGNVGHGHRSVGVRKAENRDGGTWKDGAEPVGRAVKGEPPVTEGIEVNGGFVCLFTGHNVLVAGQKKLFQT